MELDFFELVDFAGPVVILALLLALLMVLWSVSILNLQVRLLQHRVDGLERELEEMEQELEVLAHRAPEQHSAPPQPAGGDLSDLLGARQAPQAKPTSSQDPPSS
ncbi:hypothetical protein KKF91_19350 [Myxococcota bacterium]|nr:hypothetical protein [Myxococcota bacterium]MBU1432703.1 hypothetical protein [Myxococcota bacterium]MBU1899140.1 hypothetical protein [Myxococcota bacterium]